MRIRLRPIIPFTIICRADLSGDRRLWQGLLTIAVVMASIALAMSAGWANRTKHASANQSGYLR